MVDKFTFHRTHKTSPVRLIILFYFLAVVLSTILLSLPIAYQGGTNIPFIDTVFTAVSAMSVTGLSTVDMAETFSSVGYIFIAIILQFGAVGVMALGTMIWLILGRKIGLRERRLIMTDQNQTTFSGMVSLVKQIIVVLLSVELIGFLIMGTYYLQYFPTAGEAYFHGFFGTISAVTNGGFDMTGHSLIPFENDYLVQVMTMLLIIFGAIGFPVLIEVRQFISQWFLNQKVHRFTLFTKLTTTTFFTLIVVGAVFIFLFDAGQFFSQKSWHESFFYALFQSVTTKSGGLSTLDVSELTASNQLFLSFLMFIGASPSSAGGGIRTTTFALVVIFIMTYARGGKNIRLFHREIHDEDLLKAVTVTLMALALIFVAVLLMSLVESFSMLELLFDATSAFGTVGLSLGITNNLTVFSKIILMILMFIGRIGVLTFLFTFKNDEQVETYHYPKERINIG